MSDRDRLPDAEEPEPELEPDGFAFVLDPRDGDFEAQLQAVDDKWYRRFHADKE